MGMLSICKCQQSAAHFLTVRYTPGQTVSQELDGAGQQIAPADAKQSAHQRGDVLPQRWAGPTAPRVLLTLARSDRHDAAYYAKDCAADGPVRTPAGENAVIRNIEERIARVTHLPVDHGEGMQVN